MKYALPFGSILHLEKKLNSAIVGPRQQGRKNQSRTTRLA